MRIMGLALFCLTLGSCFALPRWESVFLSVLGASSTCFGDPWVSIVLLRAQGVHMYV